ncbi:ATP-binding cassette domain-containing protein [Leptothrix discophora]|uniref:ATP-binding cassette domain-containing protein n=1 Tax=Leptothrix discophora TaxID=89 RepID=A0ABT9FZH1_LEPDI|nr:ATP-binding cassette domain-containing protein [Leptothrix discophora]MDP4299626.1 ATP-binding cassette domain-containing protein [Leptothrix discophora]
MSAVLGGVPRSIDAGPLALDAAPLALDATPLALDASRPALITLRGAGAVFGTVQALAEVDLTLRRGDRLALVGANGSGKTTLLRCLHGLIDGPGERTLHAQGPAGQGRVPVMAMLFQRPFLLHLTARRNLTLALWLAGVPRAERRQRADAALERVGLQSLAERSARALSGGQQQRLALARAWALRPDILFLDEPTASLDPSAKREVETLIDDFARDGVTLVMSTHNLGQAKRLANRVIHLEAGRLVVDLPVDRFFHDTLPPAAAQFLKGELPWTT